MWWDNIINRLRTFILFGLKIETSGDSWARGSVETNAAENVWNNIGVSWIGENCSNAWFTIPITYWQINQMYDKMYDLLITFIKEHQYEKYFLWISLLNQDPNISIENYNACKSQDSWPCLLIHVLLLCAPGHCLSPSWHTSIDLIICLIFCFPQCWILCT